MSHFLDKDGLSRFYTGLKNVFAKKEYEVPLLLDTRTTNAAALAAVAPFAELKNGQTIRLWVAYATAASSTLNLTLSGGGTTGAVNVYYSGTTRLGMHYAAGNCITLTYRKDALIGTTKYTGWWCIADYNSNTTTISALTHGGAGYLANSAVYRYQMLFQMDETKMTPLNNNSDVTGATKTILTSVEFDPFGEIFYYNSTTTVSANGRIAGGSCLWQGVIDLRYAFNDSTSLTTFAPVYLKVSPQSNGKVKLASATPLVQSLPTTADGYYYIFLGRGANTNAYNLCLYAEHPVYYHDGTGIKEKLPPTVSVSASGSAYTLDIALPKATFDSAATYTYDLSQSGITIDSSWMAEAFFLFDQSSQDFGYNYANALDGNMILETTDSNTLVIEIANPLLNELKFRVKLTKVEAK